MRPCCQRGGCEGCHSIRKSARSQQRRAVEEINSACRHAAREEGCRGQENGILYGINMHNSGLVIFDRFSLENGNSVVFAKSGAGKSFTVKLEALRSMMFGTEIFIIDPENEYQRMCEAVGGAGKGDRQMGRGHQGR